MQFLPFFSLLWEDILRKQAKQTKQRENEYVYENVYENVRTRPLLRRAWLHTHDTHGQANFIFSQKGACKKCPPFTKQTTGTAVPLAVPVVALIYFWFSFATNFLAKFLCKFVTSRSVIYQRLS